MKNMIEFSGKNIHYQVSGEGKALVLLHGFIESLDIWDDFADALSNDFKVICIDLPGHGKSDVIKEIHTMDLMAECVKFVLDHLDIGTCVMLGHSMGGYVTLAFAELYPELVRGMVIFHSHAASDTPEAKHNRDRAIQIVNSEHTSFIWNFIPELFAPENVGKYHDQIDRLRKQASTLTKESIIAALEGMKLREDKLKFLSGFESPVLFIFGKKDSKIQMDKVLEQVALPLHSEVLILNSVGHMGYIEEREITLAVLKSFIERSF